MLGTKVKETWCLPNSDLQQILMSQVHYQISSHLIVLQQTGKKWLIFKGTYNEKVTKVDIPRFSLDPEVFKSA